MKLRPDQLAAHLKKELSNCYLVFGDEPLLQMEVCDQIRAAAQKSGLDDRQVFHAEAGFDWPGLYTEASSMSLFATRRLLEIRLPTGKPTDKGETLKRLASDGNPDNLFLIICPRLDAKTQNTSWFKTLEKHGVVVAVWPIEREQYPSWLRNRLQHAGIQADPAAVAMLAQHTDGNLLAAVQEIEKLKMAGISHLTEEQADNIAADHARFDAFGLADACLLGDTADACRILAHLKAEGNEPLSILGALTHKIRQLMALHGHHGQSLSQAFKNARVWPRQQGPYKKALSRLSPDDLHKALQIAESVDIASKGGEGDAWLLLSQLSIMLCDPAFSLG
ncbi:MAG: DNA polymerase III subunit delta [Oceanospirillaceae bacterium]|nr:DNA polymerase III subunit delta [Oceanospirillaceae bacterium]|tara:strand:+ start:118 stop:1122 length:1005 start_codon:yes stop_codon:yes gene_type:complete